MEYERTPKKEARKPAIKKYTNKTLSSHPIEKKKYKGSTQHFRPIVPDSDAADTLLKITKNRKFFTPWSVLHQLC